jgi:hypothetical protein
MIASSTCSVPAQAQLPVSGRRGHHRSPARRPADRTGTGGGSTVSPGDPPASPHGPYRNLCHQPEPGFCPRNGAEWLSRRRRPGFRRVGCSHPGPKRTAGLIADRMPMIDQAIPRKSHGADHTGGGFYVPEPDTAPGTHRRHTAHRAGPAMRAGCQVQRRRAAGHASVGTSAIPPSDLTELLTMATNGYSTHIRNNGSVLRICWSVSDVSHPGAGRRTSPDSSQFPQIEATDRAAITLVYLCPTATFRRWHPLPRGRITRTSHGVCSGTTAPRGSVPDQPRGQGFQDQAGA